MSLASEMVPYVCTTSAKSLLLPWSKSGKNTSNGLPTCTYSVEDSVNLLAAVVAVKSSYGISAGTAV